MSSEEWRAYKKRQYRANRTPEQREKELAKLRVNRPKLKTGKKAPVLFIDLLKLPNGKYLAK